MLTSRAAPRSTRPSPATWQLEAMGDRELATAARRRPTGSTGLRRDPPPPGEADRRHAASRPRRDDLGDRAGAGRRGRRGPRRPHPGCRHARASGDLRTRGQVMADTLVEPSPTAAATAVPAAVTVGL